MGQQRTSRQSRQWGWAMMSSGAAIIVAACGSKASQNASPSASRTSQAASTQSVQSTQVTSGLSAQPTAKKPVASSIPLPPMASGSARQLGSIILDNKTHDVATGSYASVGAAGVVIRKKDESFGVVKLTDTPSRLEAADANQYARTRTLALDHEASTYAYWEQNDKLKRRTVSSTDTGSIEELSADAEDGGVPAGVRINDESGKAHDVVAYVGGMNRKAPVVRVWIENSAGSGGTVVDVAGEPATASDVWVVAETPTKATIFWIDQRSAIAPVHAARLTLNANAEPSFTKESIVWIAPSSDLHTVLTGVKAGNSSIVMTATYKGAMSFGFGATAAIEGARPVDDAFWLEYPNGLDPAPVSGATFCSQPTALLARPADKPIDSPRILELVTLTESGVINGRLEVAKAGRIDHVAAWNSPTGDGWLLWVGDGRTLVRRVKCNTGSAKTPR